jgi:sugar lactone lactonase YvrE
MLGDQTLGHFDKVATGLYLEGLAVDTERGIVWYSDVVAGGIHGFTAGGRVASFNVDRKWTGGLTLNADGAVLSSGPGGIMWNHPDTGKSGWLLDQIDGRPINGINEMMPDATGGIYFGTVDIDRIVRGETPGPSTLYRMTVDGDLIKLVAGIRFTNGMMLSADRKHFYCNNTFECTLVFDVLSDLSLANMRTLLLKDDADGMALDVEGNLWVTGCRSGHLMRVGPDGAVLTSIETPARAITQIRFGGRDLRDFYINSVPIDSGARLKDGRPVTEHGSFMYRGRSAVPGMPIPPTRFRLA